MDDASLKAAGFSDQEIRLHKAGFSDAEIKSATAPKQATVLGTAGRALWNLPRDLGDVTSGTLNAVGGAIMHPVQTWHAATVDLPNQAAAVLGGGLQHLREMSAPEFQGDAPKMDTTAFDNALAAAKEKYGSKQAILKTIGDHPAGAALAAASVVDPALRIAGMSDGLPGAVAGAASAARKVAAPVTGAPIVSRVITPLKRIATAERTGNVAADAMRADAGARLAASQDTATAEVEDASSRAARATALADRARAQSKTLNARSSAAAAEATPPAPDVGTPAHLSDIGDTIREPAMANQDAINEDMRAADDKYRTAMQQVADDRASAGVGVSDSPMAKAMIKQSRSIVSPDPVKRPSVGSVPADSAGGKLHKMLLDVLEPQPVALSDAEAAKAVKNGMDVQTGADGGKYRVIKPDLKSVDDFRRYVGKVLNGQVEGYEAINRGEAQAMYGNLSKVIDRYVQGASKPVQQNWAAGKRALAPFENVRAGQAIVGTQAGGGGAASVPAAALPGRIISGGRDTLKQAAAVAGQDPVASALRSQVQNTLAAAKNADAAEAAVRPGTKLGDAVNTDDALSAAVRDHIARVRAAETQGENADALARRSVASMGRSQTLDKAANALQDSAERATVKARGYQQEISSLGVAQPREVGAKYINVLQRAHADGTITTDQLNQGLDLASKAEKAFALKATRDAWLRQAAITAGVSGLGAAGVGVLQTATH